MTKLITEVEIKEYLGKNQAVFPKDTIITPAARDWARSRQVRIVQDHAPAVGAVQNQKNTLTDRGDLLLYLIKTVMEELRKDGVVPDQDFIVETVGHSLVRLGHKVI